MIIRSEIYMKKWLHMMKRRSLYWVIISFGILLCVSSIFVEKTTETIILGLGTGIITSTVVALLLNIQTEKLLISQKMETKHIILNNLYLSAYCTYSKLVEKFNQFVFDVPFADFDAKYRDGTTIIYEMYMYSQQMNLLHKELATEGDNILYAYKTFVFCPFDYNAQKESVKSGLKSLFSNHTQEILEYVNDISNFNKDLLFSLGILSQSEFDKLPSTSTVGELRNAYQAYSNIIMQKELDIDVPTCALFFSLVCSNCIDMLKTIDRIMKNQKIYDPRSTFKEIDDEIAERLYNKNIGWDDRTSGYVIRRNIQL